MRTPSRRSGREGDGCRLGRHTLSEPSLKSLPLSDGSPLIVVEDRVVRIVGGYAANVDIPRRQSFPWAKLAEAYAKRLSSEHGWPIEVLSGKR